VYHHQLIAEKMGLDPRSNVSLWKDRALVEVNISVLHSFQVCGCNYRSTLPIGFTFQSQGVTIVDHHSASESFMKHMKDEIKLRGGTNGDWVWIVPPMSGSLLGVFHQAMIDYKLYPCYEYQVGPITHNLQTLDVL
jgi:nitric oxide synthase oxygenase domain/subunit